MHFVKRYLLNPSVFGLCKNLSICGEKKLSNVSRCDLIKHMDKIVELATHLSKTN